MKPLETSQRVLTWLYVYPANESTSRWKIVAYRTCFLAVLFGNIGNLTASAAYFVEYVTTNLEQALYSVAQIACYTGAVHRIGTTYLLRHRIPIVFDGLAKIYDECKYLLSM